MCKYNTPTPKRERGEEVGGAKEKKNNEKRT
jgi:hypothetical protein